MKTSILDSKAIRFEAKINRKSSHWVRDKFKELDQCRKKKGEDLRMTTLVPMRADILGNIPSNLPSFSSQQNKSWEKNSIVWGALGDDIISFHIMTGQRNKIKNPLSGRSFYLAEENGIYFANVYVEAEAGLNRKLQTTVSYPFGVWSIDQQKNKFVWESLGDLFPDLDTQNQAYSRYDKPFYCYKGKFYLLMNPIRDNKPPFQQVEVDLLNLVLEKYVKQSLKALNLEPEKLERIEIGRVYFCRLSHTVVIHIWDEADLFNLKYELSAGALQHLIETYH